MVSAPDQDPRVDDLRQRLRALGYLDAGVDRFVLGPARDARAPWVIALLASLRIGGLAAILLGPATAIGLSARLPSLVTGPRDALIIAIYFAIFFGLAIAATAFALSLVVWWTTRRTGAPVTRRAPLLSRVAGAVVTLGCLAYLTLWWQTVIAGVGWSAPAWTASALALAAAISLLLGHAVTVGSSAVVLAAARGVTTVAPAASLQRRSNLARWGARLAIGLVAFGGAALLLTWSDRTSAADATPQMLTVVPSGMRVRVIAIDGLDPSLFEGAAEARVPQTLRAALNTASIRFGNAPELVHGQDPARAWTTIATGLGPDLHGVESLETRRLTGVQGSVATREASAVMRVLRDATDLVRLTRPSVASGQERRVKTFWEVAASAGLNTVVVNWWATWPATDQATTVLSDRATLRLDRGGTLDAEISPALLYDSLRDRWSTLKERAHTLAVEAAEGVGTTPDAGIGRALVPMLALDAQQILLLSEVSTPTTDLAVVYLPGLDILRYTVRVLGQDVSVGEVAERYVHALDHLLASLLTPGPDEIVMIVTQPGRASQSSTTGLDTIDLGRLSARGVSIAPGRRGRNPPGGRNMRDAMDVAPTILYALGVPISLEVGGRPLVDLFTPDFVARYPVREVATYGPPSAPTAARSGQPLDQEAIDRLRSLGYLK
jgi:hypothetical protein